MSDRYAVLIDAGYLYAGAGGLVHGVDKRRQLQVDGAGLVDALTAHAASTLGGTLLRVYWYDAARDRVPTVEQRALAGLDSVKVRLGNLNRQGQQKGVDALLREDLETLARNRAITAAVLLAGDEDMVPAVEAAQTYGVRVHLWGIEPPYGRNQAERLVWESDVSTELGREMFAPYVDLLPPPPPRAPAAGEPAPVVAPPPAPTPALLAGLRRPVAPATLGPDLRAVHDVGEHVAGKWLVTRGRDNLADLLPGPVLPTVIDRELLVAAEEELGRSLRPWADARMALREGFWERLHREFGLRV